MAVEGIPALAEPGLAQGDAQVTTSAPGAAEYTRGLGVFPGAPSEFFGPELIAAEPTYRNLALRRPAYHSSSYDYNLTAQLVTDGIKETRLPQWVVVSTGGAEPLGKLDRETLLDHADLHAVPLRGLHPGAMIELHGGDAAPVIVTEGVTPQVVGLVGFAGVVVTAQVRLTAPVKPFAGATEIVAVLPVVALASKVMGPLFESEKVGGGT